MKNKFLFLLSLPLILTQCQKEENISIDQDLAPEVKVSNQLMIDESTPEGVTPYILNAESGLKSAPSSSYVLVFSDEFNSFDDTKWNKTVSTKTRAPRWDKGIHDWWYKEDHVSVANGKLELKASKPDDNTMYCGSADSRNLYEPLYGYLEARMQIAPISEAVHSAFWMQGHNQSIVDGSGADGCEVDIFESPHSADKAQTVLHWDGYGADKKHSGKQWSAPNIHSGYHIFAMNWTPDNIEIYYDGVKKWTYSGVGVPKVKEWLWLSVGASFGDGDFINGTYPVYAYVDYVRVWQLPEVIELQCENLNYSSPTGTSILLKSHTLASNGQHVKLDAKNNNSQITFTDVYVEKSGNYSFELNHLTWKNFGKYTCSVSNNGTWHNFSPVIDMYANTSNNYTVQLGSTYLDEGYHDITFTCVGKNANSASYAGSFDKLSLSLIP